MTQQEVIARLCKLCTDVGDEKFGNSIPHDCFCSCSVGFYAMDEEVIAFIEQAVWRALERDLILENKKGNQ